MQPTFVSSTSTVLIREKKQSYTVRQFSSVPSTINANEIDGNDLIHRTDINNADDRYLFLYKLILKKWQTNLLQKQITMLSQVCSIIQNYLRSFCPMLVTSVQAWYSNFSILFEKIITSDDNRCFHPLSYNDLALVLCKKLKEYTYIGLQDVFNTYKCTDDKCVWNDKKIMKLCEEKDGVRHLCGCAKITFFSYDYFPTYPFSKFAVTYNGKLYDIDGTFIGLLTIESLQSLQPRRTFFQACEVTQLIYLFDRNEYIKKIYEIK